MSYSNQDHSVVATYDTHLAAEAAIKALQKAGLDMKAFSIMGKDVDSEEHALGFYTQGDRINVWSTSGALWGTLWGVLFGGAFLFLPVMGPLVVMGPMVPLLIGALEGAAVGGAIGAFAATLAGIGIPKYSIVKYELEVKAGRFLVLSHGAANSIERARAVLETTGPKQLDVHRPRLHSDADALATYVTRDSILQLLSDDEVAKVSNAETGSRLVDGDEYLDLGELDRGVLRAPFSTAPMGQVLPRSAVHDDTWTNVVRRLGALPSLAQIPSVLGR